MISPALMLFVAVFILCLMTLMLANEFKLSWHKFITTERVCAIGTLTFMLAGALSITILVIGISL